MKNLDRIGEELFNKIRGRFPNVTIGDEEGNITNIPTEARYYDFSYINNGEELGSVSVSLDDETGISVIVSKDLVDGEAEDVQDKWYNFLKELRMFSKKRLLKFDVRNINKKQLNKKDYNFLATNRSGEDQMSESKMYGTKNTSYQRVGNARLAIKHSQPINVESANSRTQKIKAIYVESPEGERFKYPYRHLSGARAMARHVSEGGNAYDDFGKYISGLSEEASKLRKFTQYIGRSAVMAETLGGYKDIVKSRVTEVKKEIMNLQKESYYKQSLESFSPPMFEDVPDDIEESWIDQLTIKQFNEELTDIFPYIYRLVGEGKKAKELSFEDLVDEGSKPDFLDVDKDGNKKEPMKKALKDKKKTKEEIAIESAFESMMGQFGESNYPDGMDHSQLDGSWDDEVEAGLGDAIDNLNYEIKDFDDSVFDDIDNPRQFLGSAEQILDVVHDDAAEWANEVLRGVIDSEVLYAIMDDVVKHAKKLVGKRFAQWAKSQQESNIVDKDPKKTPIGEFILSYFDRETGKFPKGETAILTAVQKEYGDNALKPSAAFIKKVTEKSRQSLGDKGMNEGSNNEGEFEDEVELANGDVMPVTVSWQYNPAEPDTNTGDYFEFAAYDAKGNEIPHTPEDESRWADRVNDDARDAADDHGDWQQRRAMGDDIDPLVDVRRLAGI